MVDRGMVIPFKYPACKPEGPARSSKGFALLVDRGMVSPFKYLATELALCMRFLDMRISGNTGAIRNIRADWWCEEVHEMLCLKFMGGTGNDDSKQ